MQTRITRAYDKLGNVTSESHDIDGAPFVFTSDYTYDANGFRNSHTYPMGNGYVWSNNGFGHQQYMRTPGTKPEDWYFYVDQVSYHPDGSLAGYTTANSNGQVFTRSIDSLQRTSRLRSIRPGLLALDLEYGYDASSRISSILDRTTILPTASGNHHSVSNIQYDALGQLTRADGHCRGLLHLHLIHWIK